MFKHGMIWGALAALAVMAIGCGEVPAPAPLSPVTAPEVKSLAKPGNTDPTPTTTITPVSRRTRSVNGFGGTASKVMTSSSGGSLSYMGHSLEVSKYSFSEQQKEFYITDVSSNYIQANYGPDGWFLVPIKVTISFADANLKKGEINRLTIAWYDETLDRWVDAGGIVDQVSQTITTYVWHFTQYTLSVK
ncbi:hypothetical protein HUU39_05890 [candidate division KSB1 bacterium]|nr:hypothetical protein [bacterium]NUM64792.1 hypothetical protein [candidate division KSB1 bacterium]